MTVPSETQVPALQRDYPRIFWRWKWLVLACLIVVPLAAFGVASRARAQYSSSALVHAAGPPVDASLFPSVVVPTPQDAVLRSVARLVTVSDTARRAATYLHPRPRDPLSLLRSVTASADTAAGFITVTATSPSAKSAADVANAFARAVVTNRTRNAINQLDSTISQLDDQLASRPRSDIQGRLALSGQVQRFRTLRAAQDSGAQIVEAASPATKPTTPGIARAVGLGLLIGALIAVGLVLFLDSRDHRIRSSEELEGLTGLPQLGAIPATAFSGAELTHADEEAFRTLRNSLTCFNIDRRISSVLITSPVKEDGKTTVAINLAVAMARAGKDVILVEADLRRPAAALRFGVAKSTGLGAVLVDELSLGDALTEVSIPGPGEGRLRLIPAGPTPPNPSELIGSQRMRSLIGELESIADLVILDSTPLLTIGDSLPLVEAVSGVVLIARVDTTTHASLVRLQQVVANAGGHALGVVATGISDAGLRKGYGYGYSHHPVAGQNARADTDALEELVVRADAPSASHHEQP